MSILNAIDSQFGANGLAGQFAVFPSTASKGSVVWSTASNAGNTQTTLTNAALATSSVTYTIPDPGTTASYLMNTGAQTWVGVSTFSAVPIFSAGISLISGQIENFYQDTTIASADVKTLFTTPVTIISAPGAGLGVIPLGVYLYQGGGTAYTSVNAMQFTYTNAAGNSCCGTSNTLILTTAGGARNYCIAKKSTAGGNSTITPTANAPVVISMTTGNPATGNFSLKVRAFYKIIPTTF